MSEKAEVLIEGGGRSSKGAAELIFYVCRMCNTRTHVFAKLEGEGVSLYGVYCVDRLTQSTQYTP